MLLGSHRVWLRNYSCFRTFAFLLWTYAFNFPNVNIPAGLVVASCFPNGTCLLWSTALAFGNRDYSYWGHVAEGSLRKGVHCTTGKVQSVLDFWFYCSCYCSMFAVYLCVDGCKGTYVPLPVYGDQRRSYESCFPCQAWQQLPLHWASSGEVHWTSSKSPQPRDHRLRPPCLFSMCMCTFNGAMEMPSVMSRATQFWNPTVFLTVHTRLFAVQESLLQNLCSHSVSSGKHGPTGLLEEDPPGTGPCCWWSLASQPCTTMHLTEEIGEREPFGKFGSSPWRPRPFVHLHLTCGHNP